MLSFPSSVRVFAATEPVDFRKSHDGLYAIVRHQFKEDPFDGSVFAFQNKRRDRIKLLVWDRNGFWLFYKRLEKGTFRELGRSASGRVEITRAELSMLLEGIDLEKGKYRKHFREGVAISGRHDGGDEGRARATDQRAALAR